MIPRASITAWRSRAPWSRDEQVEQDLVLSRAIIEIYSDPLVAQGFAFRGGTALYKIHLKSPERYSEDIDLVQVEAGPIGPAMTAIHERLDPWLGKPKWKQSRGRVTFLYRFDSEIRPVTRLRLKLEINTREHLTVLGWQTHHFEVGSSWFSGSADVLTYFPEEMLGTKLKALYQRRKGRDLFDLAVAIENFPSLDTGKIVECFERYLASEGLSVSRAEFEANLAGKLDDQTFREDLGPLLAVRGGQQSSFNMVEAGYRIQRLLIEKLPGRTEFSA